MRVFVYQLRGTHHYLATNPKVMSRSLRHQESLVRVLSKRRYLHFATKSIYRGFPPRYVLLTRNPYTRTESFFRDKIRTKPHRAIDPAQHYPLKRCQTILLPHLGVECSDPLERQVDALLGLTFDTFVELLPDVYLQDDHLSPQTWNYERRIFGRSVRMGFDALVPIEDAASLEETARRYRLDLTKRVNATNPDATGAVHWTSAARETVRRLYHQDFVAFGYPDE